LRRIIRSGTDCLPPALIRVGLINEAQLKCRLSELGKMDSDPIGYKADHTSAVPTATIDPIFQLPLKSAYEGGREVYMMGNREEISDKMVEEIQ
jgi:hypothetical protein